MKCLIRYFSLFLCSVLLFIGCSSFVSAEELDNSKYNLSMYSNYKNASGTWVVIGQSAWAHGDGEVYGTHFNLENVSIYGINPVIISNDYYINTNDGSPLARKGKTISIKLDQMYLNHSIYSNKYLHNTNVPDEVYAYLFYTDGTASLHEVSFVLRSDNTFDVNISVPNVRQDVLSVKIVAQSMYENTGNNVYVRVSSYCGEYNDNYFRLTVDITPEDVQLLGGILEWIQNIFNGITEGFTNLGNGISNVWNSILELPSKIWEFIENGLKDLFVPDEEYIVGYKDRWDNLLSDKLGAVYQVANVTFGAWEQVGEADESNIISIPSISIPLPDNNEFSFGGYDVEIVPQGFEFIVEVLKLAVGIACTILFVNGLRKRYDEVMGVEQ